MVLDRLPADMIPAIFQIMEIMDRNHITIAQLPQWLDAVADLDKKDVPVYNRDSLSTQATRISSRSSCQSRTHSYISDISIYSDDAENPQEDKHDITAAVLPLQINRTSSQHSAYEQCKPQVAHRIDIASPPPSDPPSRPLPALPKSEDVDVATAPGQQRPRQPSPGTQQTHQDQKAFCHNCEGLESHSFDDLRRHWAKKCENIVIYSCAQCKLLCKKQTDMKRHLMYTGHTSSDDNMIAAPSKQAYGCPHCGQYFDHEHFPSEKPSKGLATLRDCFLDHLLEHFKHGAAMNGGDPTIRVRALLRRARTQESMRTMCETARASGMDYDFMRWSNRDALHFAHKLEHGLLQHHTESQYAKYHISDPESFANDLIRKCINQADFRTSNSRAYIRRESQTLRRERRKTEGPRTTTPSTTLSEDGDEDISFTPSPRRPRQSDYSRETDQEIRDKTAQILGNQFPVIFPEDPFADHFKSATLPMLTANVQS